MPSKIHYRCLIFLATLNAYILSSPLFANKESRGTKLHEIEKWKDLNGGQYVLGYGRDESGELVPFAVYDKLFPSPSYGRFWRASLLGIFGISNIHTPPLNLLEKTNRKARQKKAAKDIHRLLFMEKGTDIFPEDWWKNPNLQWKPGKKPDLFSQAPQSINFADLVFDTEQKDKKIILQKQLDLFTKFSEILHESHAEASPKIQNLLQNAQFQRQTDGTYSLVLLRDDTPIRPAKIIDLRGQYSSYKTALLWDGITDLTKQLTNALPIPILASFIYLGLERFFNLIDVIYLTHHAMAMSLVMEALDGNTESPFYGALDEQELQKAVTYLKRSSIFHFDLVANALIKKELVAKKFIDEVEKKRTQSISYLQRHHFKVYPLPRTYYALGIKRKDNNSFKDLKVFSLLKNSFFGRKPHDAIDFLHPNRELRKRQAMELILAGTCLMQLPIPFLASIIRTLYKEIFIKEIHRRDVAEAGLKGYLNHSRQGLVEALLAEGFPTSQANEMVSQAYKMILRQEMNPIELDPEEEDSYKRKVEAWIVSKDPSYVPVSEALSVI